MKHTMRQCNAKPHGSQQQPSDRPVTGSASWLTTALLATVLAVGAFAQEARAQENGDETSFDEADLFLELNDTDGDLGIQAFIDGDAYRTLVIRPPNGSRLLFVRATGRLGRQGLNELGFESDEPPLDEFPQERFFRRFPEGEYLIRGRTLEGDLLENTAELTHVLPAPPAGITVSGTPIDPDSVDCDEGPLPLVTESEIIISWDPVTLSHPEVGRTGELEVDSYQVVVEQDVGEQELIFSVDLPPFQTEVQVPPEFIGLGAEEFDFEILVREASGNLTAIESCFAVAG